MTFGQAGLRGGVEAASGAVAQSNDLNILTMYTNQTTTNNMPRSLFLK
jgi:hypothetical protein